MAGIKPGQRQLISEAWEKHVADRKKTSVTKAQINDAFETMWTAEMESFMNETFLANIHLPSTTPAVAEVYTTNPEGSTEAWTLHWSTHVFGDRLGFSESNAPTASL